MEDGLQSRLLQSLLLRRAAKNQAKEIRAKAPDAWDNVQLHALEGYALNLTIEIDLLTNLLASYKSAPK